MNQMTTPEITEERGRRPVGELLGLAATAFITLVIEILPAGLLSQIAQDLTVSESSAGQFITAYAVGMLIAAIPAVTLTQRMRRRSLLLTSILGCATVNLATVLSTHYTTSSVARFFCGVFGGTVWSLLTGYAVRISPTHLRGRAIAISGAGATLALVFGVPRTGRHESIRERSAPFPSAARMALANGAFRGCKN